MKSQICIFVLVATIIWQSSGVQSQNTFKPESENVTKICIIKTGQDSTISKFTKAMNIFFTSIRARISRITDDNKNVSNQGTSSTSRSKREMYIAFTQGVEMYLDTVRRLTRDYDSWADTTARRIIHESIQGVVVNIHKALDLTVNNDYSEIQHEIQELQKETALQAAAVCKGAYVGIKQGRKFSDEMQSTIDSFEEGAIYFAVQSINYIFAGIRTLGDISSANNTRSEDTVFAIEYSQREATAAINSGAKYIYALIRYLYCTLSVDEMDMSTSLATLDSQQDKANRKIKQGIDIFVSVIKSTASNVMEANRKKMNNQSCMSEIAENEVYEAWLEAVNYLLDSSSLVQAVKPSIDTTSRHIVTNGLKDVVRITFEGIRAVQNESYAECMLQLDRLQNARIDSDLTLTRGLFVAIRNCRIDSEQMTKIINHAYDRTVPYLMNASTGIFDGIRFLANVLSTSEGSRPEDWSALDIAASKAYSEWIKEIDIYYELLHFFVVSSAVKNDDIVSYFFAVRSTRDIAISEFCKGIRLIFTKMETDLRNIYSENDDSSCEESTQHLSQQSNNPSASKDFKNKAKVALGNSLNATMNLLATTGLVNSSAIKSAFSASVVATIDIIDDIFQLIDSAMGEECTETVSEMHKTESSLTAKLIAFFRSISDVIRSSQKNGNDKNEAAIKQADSEMVSNTVNAIHALYSGIEILKTNIELQIRGGSKESFSAMKAAETETCFAVEADLKLTFTLIQTLLASSHSKSNRIPSIFAEIQSAREITAVNCQKGLGIVLRFMKRVAANTTPTHQTENQPNMASPTIKNVCRQSIESYPDASLTYYTFKTAVDGFFNLIPKIQPEATATVETARSGMYIAIDQFAEETSFAFELIQCNFSSEVLAAIDIMEKTADCALTAIIKNYYIPIKYDLEPGTETYRYVEKAETDAITMILKTWKPIFTGLKILFYESFPALDNGYQARSLSIDDIEKKSRSFMEALIRMIYDTVVYKFVHLSGNHHGMLNTTCPSTGV